MLAGVALALVAVVASLGGPAAPATPRVELLLPVVVTLLVVSRWLDRFERAKRG